MFDLLKQGRVTHILDGCSAILISSSDLLKQGRATHWLDACSAILVCGFVLLRQGRTTYFLDACSIILVSGSVLFIHQKTHSQAGHAFNHSHQKFCSAQTLARNSHPGCMFNNSCQWFWSAKHWRTTHFLGVACSVVLVSGSDLFQPWWATHILKIFPIRKNHFQLLQSYQIALQKLLIRFQ